MICTVKSLENILADEIRALFLYITIGYYIRCKLCRRYVVQI